MYQEDICFSAERLMGHFEKESVREKHGISSVNIFASVLPFAKKSTFQIFTTPEAPGND